MKIGLRWLPLTAVPAAIALTVALTGREVEPVRETHPVAISEAPASSIPRPPPPAAAADSSSEDPELARVRLARLLGDEQALVLALSNGDPIVQLEAIDAIEERGCTRCIRDLVGIDVTRDGHVGATTIATLGVLARQAPLPERRIAVERLVDLLGSEGRRAGPEAAANVLGALEALGGVEDSVAKRALERVLEDRSLDIATQILVIHGIGPHPSDGARRRLVAIRQERALEHGLDDFEAAIHRELDEAISASLGG